MALAQPTSEGSEGWFGERAGRELGNDKNLKDLKPFQSPDSHSPLIPNGKKKWKKKKSNTQK